MGQARWLTLNERRAAVRHLKSAAHLICSLVLHGIEHASTVEAPIPILTCCSSR